MYVNFIQMKSVALIPLLEFSYRGMHVCFNFFFKQYSRIKINISFNLLHSCIKHKTYGSTSYAKIEHILNFMLKLNM